MGNLLKRARVVESSTPTRQNSVEVDKLIEAVKLLKSILSKLQEDQKLEIGLLKGNVAKFEQYHRQIAAVFQQQSELFSQLQKTYEEREEKSNQRFAVLERRLENLESNLHSELLSQLKETFAKREEESQQSLQALETRLEENLDNNRLLSPVSFSLPHTPTSPVVKIEDSNESTIVEQFLHLPDDS